MAKFKASPFYSVHTPKGKINFDHNGVYETDKADETNLLKELSPRYLTAVDEGKAVNKETPAKAETKAEAKPKPATTKKPAAKK